jgi:acyl-CoA reductase-like NAD-dependent aldehyde dehydrogenase
VQNAAASGYDRGHDDYRTATRRAGRCDQGGAPVTAQASFNPRNGLVVPAPAPGTPGAVDAVALATGCPVVVKAHPAHPRLSARLAEIAGEAMTGAGVTTGPFGIVHGFDAGTRLVSHPTVRAVGFTGSLAGGLALWRLAAARPEVIPVYAEMGTVNIVVVTPSAAAERPAEIAAGFVGSPRRVDGVAA